MSDPTPRAIVSSACIAYSEALLQYRRSAVTDEFAIQEGQDLFRWLGNVGALTDAKAPIAVRNVELGITILRSSPESAERIRDQIKASYIAYAGNA